MGVTEAEIGEFQSLKDLTTKKRGKEGPLFSEPWLKVEVCFKAGAIVVKD